MMGLVQKLVSSGCIDAFQKALYNENEEEAILQFLEARKKFREVM